MALCTHLICADASEICYGHGPRAASEGEATVHPLLVDCQEELVGIDDGYRPGGGWGGQGGRLGCLCHGQVDKKDYQWVKLTQLRAITASTEASA